MRAEPQDFSRVLSSMCTEPHPAAREAAETFLATNPGDPGTYRSVAELEADAVDALGGIVGLDDPHGYVASGGTEANIQAVRAARNLAATSDPNVVMPESAHFSFRKAAGLLGVELRTAPVDDDYRAHVDAMPDRPAAAPRWSSASPDRPSTAASTRYRRWPISPTTPAPCSTST